MAARGRLVLFLCAATASLALPAGAAAKPGYYVFRPQRTTLLNLPSSNGYRLQIYAEPRTDVSLVAFRFKGGSIDYHVPGRSSGDRITANFGRFGRISMRFQPDGPPKREGAYGKRCKGRRPTRQQGKFVGSILFRGESGFISVHERSVRGTVYKSFRLVCRMGRGGHRLKGPRFLEKGYSLSAVVKGRAAAPWFSVFKEDPRRHSRVHWSSEDANYLVSATERRGRLTIDRSASATAEPETFPVEPLGVDPTVATVTPPAPFTGSARFEQLPNGESSWAGDLAVELPGMGTVQLTGSGYQADLCRGFKCACPRGYCSFIIFSSGRLISNRPSLPTAAAPTPSPWRWPGSPR
ncbi:MAG TPA: hypothetical protein VF009_02695 [Solirubrobacterales bacterium]